MPTKVTVGLCKKRGLPNFGSISVSCHMDVHLDDQETATPETVTAYVERAFARCRNSIAQELAKHESEPTPAASTASEPASHRHPARPATDAQVRAIRAIASKQGIVLAVELHDRFGVRSPNQLTLTQASQLIDSLKSQPTAV